MTELSNLIFHGADNTITSNYGPRKSIKTAAGNTSSFHDGIDYGTYGKKIAQYAIADGVVSSCGRDTAYGGALFVWVKYPSLGVRMLHYHLDRYCVKPGQTVNKNTLIGYTGRTGRATGVHLHLGVKLLSGGGYIDGEKWYKENKSKFSNNKETTKESGSATKYTTGNYKVTKAEVLHVRTGPGTQYRSKGYNELTLSARNKIKKLSGEKNNGYVRGLTFTVSEVKGNWGKTPSGWVCLDYCGKV